MTSFNWLGRVNPILTIRCKAGDILLDGIPVWHLGVKENCRTKHLRSKHKRHNLKMEML